MIVKCGRKEYDLDENDEILFNGKCYQITTRKRSVGWFESPEIIAKGKAEKMVKDGLFVVKRVSGEKYPLIVYKIKS